MDLEKQTALLNSVIEEFVKFKKFAEGLKINNPQYQSAMHHLDTGFLWLREAIFAEVETPQVPPSPPAA